MNKRFPIKPKHPERICWGCSRYCPATDMACGNGAVRCQHPIETGDSEWLEELLQNNNKPTAVNPKAKPRIKLRVDKDI